MLRDVVGDVGERGTTTFANVRGHFTPFRVDDFP